MPERSHLRIFQKMNYQYIKKFYDLIALLLSSVEGISNRAIFFMLALSCLLYVNSELSGGLINN